MSTKAWREVHREDAVARTRTWIEAHREERRAWQVAYWATHREEISAHNRLRRYGLTPEAFDSLLAGQGGVCAICGTGAPKRGWVVDHDHESGVVRGLLCHTCNVVLGYVNDDVKVLAAAIAYLANQGATMALLSAH